MRLVIAASAFIALATPAVAQPMVCVFTSNTGSELVYTFEKVTNDLYAEAGFSKDGVSTVSPIGKRPPWKRIDLDSGVTLTYMRDQRFWIGIPNGKAEVSDDGSVIGKFAIVSKGKALIGKGGCGFSIGQSRPQVPDGL